MAKKMQWTRPFLCPVLLFFAAPAAPAPAQEANIAYEVHIEGVENETLQADLREASALVERKDQPPDSIIVLRRLAERDVINLVQALRAEAYYGAVVTPELDESARPVNIVLRVEPGPQYALEEVRVEYVERPGDPPKPLPQTGDLSLQLNEPALSEAILAAQGELVVLLKQRGFPYPQTSQPRVIVDHAARAVRVVYPVQTGPPAEFGKTLISGNITVREDFLRARIPWKRGQLFDSRLLDEYDEYLRKTGLFSLTGVSVAEQLDEWGDVPVVVDLRERAHHTVKTGISFQSDEGLGARASWENRNLYGRGETLTLNVQASQLQYKLQSIFIKPQFVRPDQTLRWETSATEEDTEAYFARRAFTCAQVERALTERISIGTGLGFCATRERQFGESATYNLVSLPSFFTFDLHKGDPLNPEGGGRLNLRAAPSLDVGGGLSFLRTQLTYSHYLKVSEKPHVVLAGRINLGSIVGGRRSQIPATERFYAGGGGSIRGYEYQKVGPLRDDTPVGGRSLAEFSLEARIRISDRIGIVPFVDGGSVLESSWPNGTDMHWGAGIGLRYFSPIGPVRFDVAVPINRRSGVDEPFQIYISLGQAF